MKTRLIFLAGFLAFAMPALAQERMERLSREAFDVITPDSRITGAPGSMHVWQAGCRVGPTNWARRRIVDIAVQEWAAFGFQTIDAGRTERRALPPGLVPDRLNPDTGTHIARNYVRLGIADDEREMAAAIGGYWSATPQGAGVLAGQNRIWNAVRGDVHWAQPWSAAFVSWVMCEAGLGDPAQFARDASHRVYIDQAIAARDGMAPMAAFTAYDAGEARIEPGDLLCNGRGTAVYRLLADRRRDAGSFAPTHCDIVVKVDEGARRILVIGGNVQFSVSLTVLPATAEAGRQLHAVSEDMVEGARTIFAHLKLNADAVELNALDNAPTIRAMANR